MDTYQQRLAAARDRVEEVDPEALDSAADLIVDVRTANETALGLIPNAIAVPMDRVTTELDALDLQRDDARG